MNSGLIFDRAIERLLRANQGSDKPVYVFFSGVYRDAALKNIPFQNSLYAFAQGLRSRALLRFSMLLLDNVSKGSDLCSKLEAELKTMQDSRLQAAGARAHRAETKLCFPLMLILIAIIIICSAPAFMQM